MKVKQAAQAFVKAATPAILIFDIETTPHEGYFWKVWDENIGPEQIRKPSELLCWAAKWLGGKTIMYAGRLDARGKVCKTDRDLCRTLHRLIEAADIIVAHNGRAFDVKTANARWLANGLPPPSPVKICDTCLVARKYFNFPHNSLQGLATYLGLGDKAEHEGFKLWKRCLAGCAKAWGRMERYNIQDVLLLERVYLRLRAWDSRHPNVGLLHEDADMRCVCCGAKALKLMPQPARTAVSQFPAYRCGGCGKVNRSGKALGAKENTRPDVMRNAL